MVRFRFNNVNNIYIYIYIKRKNIYIPLIVVSCIVLNVGLLSYVFSLSDGMLLSSYVFDLVMAILYVLFFVFKTYKASLLLDAIILSKLLGDLFACVEYKDYHLAVFIIGIIVLMLNILCYVVYLLKIKGIINFGKFILKDKLD